MCKILAIPNINDKNRTKVMAFIHLMTEYMIQGEKDGFGYCATDKQGRIFSEKWIDYKEIFKTKNKKNNSTLDLKLKSFLDGTVYNPIELNYSSYGQVNRNNMTCFVGHSRFATSGPKTIENCHPFIIDDVAFVHNGIVYNHELFDKKVSNNDSEAILQQYLDYDIRNKPDDMTKALIDLDAYFGCFVLFNKLLGNGKYEAYLDVFKNDALLYAAYIADLETYCICTSENFIKKACQRFKYKYSSIMPLYDNVLTRINVFTGNIELSHDFEYKRPVKNTPTLFDDKYYTSKYGSYGEEVKKMTSDYEEYNGFCGYGGSLKK